MTTHDFALWLHGFTELTGGAMPTEVQWKMIVEHLDLAFNKVTKPLLPLEFAPRQPMAKPLDLNRAAALPVGSDLPKVRRILTERQLDEELHKKMQEENKAAANEAERKRRQAEKDAQAVKEAEHKRSAEIKRGQEVLEQLRKAAEKVKQDPVPPVPFYPQLPQPMWLPNQQYPDLGIAYPKLPDANKFMC